MPKTEEPGIRSALRGPSTRVQFQLRTMMLTITGICPLLAILAALGVGPGQLLFGFTTFSVVAMVSIGVVEAFGRSTAKKRS